MSKVPSMFAQPPSLPPQAAAPMPIPLFREMVVHHANLSVLDAGDDKTILRFLMPNGEAVSVILDDTGKEAVVQALKGTNITIARPGG